jgi:spore coat polysaccharide biosynthesis protein SpsF
VAETDLGRAVRANDHAHVADVRAATAAGLTARGADGTWVAKGCTTTRDRTLCVVQARAGSTRLPGKVLADLAGRPMLRFLLDRLVRARVDDVVVATSAEARDDAVADVARAAGVAVVRGSEHDVLDRFVTALDALGARPTDHVVRVTADCPLTDPALVERVVARHVGTGADFTSNTLPRTFPKGLDVEVATVAALRTAHAEAGDGSEREHVMPFLYRRPERFRLANVRNAEPLGHERWTVDTADDLERVRAICARMGENPYFGWRAVLEAVGRAAGPEPGEVALRPAYPDDSAFVLDCRNDADAVRFSGSGHAIAPDAHARWFAARLDDPGAPMWVAEVDGTRVGTARVDVRTGTGEVGIAVHPAHRGRGRGRGLLGALLTELQGDQQVVELVARVHQANRASMRAFLGAGFVPVEGAGAGFAVLRRDPRVPMEKP